MGQVIVRNLDEKIIAALKAKAELHGHSLERELRASSRARQSPTPTSG